MGVRIAVLLHNVRSTHNVGSIFRTADAAGVESILLTGYTPTPVDRFKRPRKDIAKTALGAERFLSWEYHASPMTILKKFKGDGWHVVGVEQDDRACSYRMFSATRPTLFVFGNEVRGLSEPMRKACDRLIEIPMHGKKESLNVSVAAGVILFSCTSRGAASDVV